MLQRQVDQLADMVIVKTIVEFRTVPSVGNQFQVSEGPELMADSRQLSFPAGTSWLSHATIPLIYRHGLRSQGDRDGKDQNRRYRRKRPLPHG